MGDRPRAQRLAYDAWWHLGYDTMVTSEWGTPDTFERLVPEVLLGSNYGRRLHFWDLNGRAHLQEIDFGPENIVVFELPRLTIRATPMASSMPSSASRISSSIWTWYREKWPLGGAQVIDIPAEPPIRASCPTC